MFGKKQDLPKPEKEQTAENELGISSEIPFDEGLPGTVSYTYRLNYNDVYECLKKMHSEKGLGAKKVQFILLAGLFIINLYYFIKNPSENQLCAFLALVALVFGVYAGMMPYNFRKKEAKKQAERNRELTLSMNRQSFSVLEKGERTNMAFSDVKACYEDKEQYNLLLSSGKIFCVPKREMPDETKEIISQILTSVLQDRYQYRMQKLKL